MERMEVQGKWWLPENPDQVVPGTLVIAEDAIELTLLGTLRHETAYAVAQDHPDGSKTYTFTEESMTQGGVYPRIVGESGTKGYTLEDCFQIQRTNLFGGGLQTQRINVHSVFEGIQFDPGEPLEFTEMVIKLDGLVLFVQRSGMAEKIETKEVDGRHHLIRHTISTTPVPDETFDGIDGAKCRLMHLWKTGVTEFVEHRVSQDFAVHVQFEQMQPVDRLLAIASHVQDLVTIATGRRAAFASVSLRHPDVARERTGKVLPIEMYAKWTVKAQADKKPLRAHDVAFSLNDFGGGEALSRWLKVADEYASALGRVMISRYSDTSYASDLLLNAAAALEGYHRDKYEGGKDNNTKFAGRITKCVQDAGAIFDDLVSDTELFTILLKKNRVAVAHHLSGAEGTTQQIFLGRAAAWLLIICLLRDAGAPEAIFDKIKERQDWHWLKRHVAEVLAEAAPQGESKD